MATWRSCNSFDLLHINKGCHFEPGTRSNQWADESNTERAVTNFVTQTTRVFLLTQLITRQYTNFHISSIHLEIQGARMVTQRKSPKILRCTKQNSDHHDDPAPRIYPALFFPPVNPCSSTTLGRNADDTHSVLVFISPDVNGGQLLLLHPASSTFKSKVTVDVSSIETSLTDCCL